VFGEQGTFPLDNLSFDLVCLIYEKSKGLKALDSYLDDARGDPKVAAALHHIRSKEGQFITELQRLLVDRILEAKSPIGFSVLGKT